MPSWNLTSGGKKFKNIQMEDIKSILPLNVNVTRFSFKDSELYGMTSLKDLLVLKKV